MGQLIIVVHPLDKRSKDLTMTRKLQRWSSFCGALLAVAVATSGVFLVGHARAAPKTEEEMKARELFRLAEDHYEAGRYEKATVFYEEAHALCGRPELLLALANTYERMSSYGLAIDRLKQYLEHPRAKHQAALRDRLQRLERTDRERKAERVRLEQLERERLKWSHDQSDRHERSEKLPSGLPVQKPKEPRLSAPAGSGLPAILLLGTGVAGLAGAVGFGLAARHAHDEASRDCQGDFCKTMAVYPLERERRFAILSDVSLGVGLASSLVGTILLWKRRRDGRRERALQVVQINAAILPGRGGIGAGATF